MAPQITQIPYPAEMTTETLREIPNRDVNPLWLCPGIRGGAADGSA